MGFQWSLSPQTECWKRQSSGNFSDLSAEKNYIGGWMGKVCALYQEDLLLQIVPV